MLRHLFTDPLLVREMISEARKASSERFNSGLNWMLILSGLTAALFLIYGKRGDFYSSCLFCIIAVWLQSWMLFRRAGMCMAASLASNGERGAFCVLRTSPFSIIHAVFVKFVGTLMPLGLEIVLAAVLNGAVYAFWGSAPWFLIACAGAFHFSLILFSASLGAWFGFGMSSTGKSANYYSQLATLVGLLGLGMSYSKGLGCALLITFTFYMLLCLLPALNERMRTVSASIALLMVMFMPLGCLVNLSPVYNAIKRANPFVALWQTQPVDLSDTRALLLTNLAEDEGFHKFADRCFSEMTGEEHLPDHPRWLEIFSNTVDNDPYAGCVFNEMYFSWRMRNLCIYSLNCLLFFALNFYLLWRKANKIAGLGT
ncbi:MAG: hypothetical protein Q4F00_04850 [bacterium]|nr:hypothetical protein [bacterium]